MDLPLRGLRVYHLRKIPGVTQAKSLRKALRGAPIHCSRLNATPPTSGMLTSFPRPVMPETTSYLTGWTDSGAQDPPSSPAPPAPCCHRAPPGGAKAPMESPPARGSRATCRGTADDQVIAPPPASSRLASAFPSLPDSLGTPGNHPLGLSAHRQRASPVADPV